MRKEVIAALIILGCAFVGVPISIWNGTIAFILLFSGIFYVIFFLYDGLYEKEKQGGVKDE